MIDKNTKTFWRPYPGDDHVNLWMDFDWLVAECRRGKRTRYWLVSRKHKFKKQISRRVFGECCATLFFHNLKGVFGSLKICA